MVRSECTFPLKHLKIMITEQLGKEINSQLSKKDLFKIKSPLDIAIKRVLETKPQHHGLLSDRL